MKPYLTGTLVECGDDGLQICRESFLARDFLKSSAHLSHGLGPTACGIGQKQDVQSHLPVILRHRDGRVDRCFSGCDRHRRRVADDDGSFHQRTSGLGVDQLGEFLENLDDLTCTLSARGDDNDVHVRITALHVLEDGLSGTERSRHAERTALCHRQEGIDDPDLHDQRLIGSQALVIAADGSLDRPAEHHGELPLLAFGTDDRGHLGPDVVLALLDNACDLPVHVIETERKHDPVGEDSLGDSTERIAGSEYVSDFPDRSELPVLVRNRIHIDSPVEEEAALLRQ